jgi:hypothetical protein
MYNILQNNPALVMLPSVTVLVVLILQEHVFVPAVYRKCHCRDAQAGEAASESVESREWTGVSPCLTIVQGQLDAQISDLTSFKAQTHARAHGSFAGVPAAAANAFGSKPDRFPRGGEALRTLQAGALAIAILGENRYQLNAYLVKRILGIVTVRKADFMKL